MSFCESYGPQDRQQTYRQCDLSRENYDNTFYRKTVWIPSEFAHVGRLISLKLDGEWVDDWIVDKVHTDPMTEVEIAPERRGMPTMMLSTTDRTKGWI